MAEIGLAASIIAVIQITTSVTKKAYEYGEAVKNAAGDIARIKEQLSDLTNILQKLKTLADLAEQSGKSLDQWPTLASLKNPDGALLRCKLAMLGLEAELAPADGGAKRMLQRSLWPMKKKKMQQKIAVIEKQKVVFMETLSVEQM